MSLLHQPKPEPVGVLPRPHVDGFGVPHGIVGEQRPEPVAELVGEVGPQVPDNAAALGQQGIGLRPQPVVVEAGGHGTVGQQGMKQSGLLGGQALPTHVSTARMAASSAASSSSDG
jgi:hypothetical protein